MILVMYDAPKTLCKGYNLVTGKRYDMYLSLNEFVLIIMIIILHISEA
jgi:hypothetical protein